MRIAICTTMQHPASVNTGWGMESFVWDLIECLDKEGHEIFLFAKEGSDHPSNGVLITCKTESEVLEKYTSTLSKMDIVHDWSGTKTIHDYCQKNNIKSLASQFNIHFLYPTIHKNIVCVSDIQTYLGKAGKSGFENTPWEQQVGYTGHLLGDAKRIYLGINLDVYTSKYDKQDYILFFNSWDYRKGVTVALDLAKTIGFNLILAGSTQHYEHIQTFNDLKITMDSMPNVKYFTDVSNEQKIELMQGAKALLFPSLFYQPFATVVIQALACGTPVIATNMGAMPEMIKHGKTGFLCKDIDQLSKAINSIKSISNTDCRLDMEKRFDRKIMAKEYIKLYEAVIRGESW